MGVTGTMSIYPRSLAGASPAELEEMLIAKTQPAFSTDEMKTLRAALKQWQFSAGKNDVFKHSAFDCEAHLTATSLWFETSSDFDAMMTAAEVAGTLAMEPGFAMFDSGEGTWTAADEEPAAKATAKSAETKSAKSKSKSAKSKSAAKPKTKSAAKPKTKSVAKLKSKSAAKPKSKSAAKTKSKSAKSKSSKSKSSKSKSAKSKSAKSK
ncbi:MAG: hypothetical protein QM831_15280 [Kofleriaceae bacterium]